MNRHSLYGFLAIALFSLAQFSVAGTPSKNKDLQTKMGTLAKSLKQIQVDIKLIKGSSKDHSKEWADGKSNAELMAKTADESKKLYPDHIVGDKALEKDFEDTLVDLSKTITAKLVKAFDQKEITDAENAVKEVITKRNAAHGKFMPPEPKDPKNPTATK